MAFNLLLLIFLLFSPFAFLVIGEFVIKLLAKVTGSDLLISRDQPFGLPVIFIAGLLCYLYLALALKSCKLPWAVSALLPIAPLFFSLNTLRSMFARVRLFLNLNFGLWLFVVLSLGVSLFDTLDGIATPWANNYGDLTFHLGMISSFVLGDNFPPEYHLFAGEALSYPFLINFWSSLYWWISPEWSTLSIIFTFQWTLLWSLVYILLNGNRYPLLAWALLLGGGSYLAFGPACGGAEVCLTFGKNSGQLIGKNVPWTVFLTTIWVTQRTALFGVVTALTALLLFHQRKPEQKGSGLLLAGLILSASFLVHTHITLFSGAYVGICLFLSWLLKRSDIQRKQELFGFSLGLVPAVLNLFWMHGKAGTTKFISGWSTGVENISTMGSLLAAAQVWYQGPLFLALIILIFWGLSRKHLNMLVLLILFLLANLVQLAVWDWDQLKVFLALYLIFLSLWASSEQRELWWIQFALIPAIIPALVESLMLLNAGQNHTIYTRQNIELARSLTLETAPGDVIAVNPIHNSLATLSGRRLFYGYEGTLHSHGIDYSARQKIHKDFDLLSNCKEVYAQQPESCPDVLLWTEEERKYWTGKNPNGKLEPTKFQHIWRFKNDN